MTNHFLLTSLLGVYCMFCSMSGNVPQLKTGEGSITIQLKNIEEDKGFIRIALYAEADHFLDEEKGQFFSFPVQQKDQMEIVLEDIGSGEYALAIFHDENSNQKLEKNFLGIPTEPYCFSGQGHSKWRPPLFDNAKFQVIAPQSTPLTLQLEKWQL